MMLEEFKEMSKDKRVEYDFKYEVARLREINDAIERFFIYRASDSGHLKSCYIETARCVSETIKNYPGLLGFDCDKSPLIMSIEDVLWKKDSRNLALSSDTMNSAQTTLNELIRYAIETPEEKKYRGRRRISTGYCLFLYSSAPEEFLLRINEYAKKNNSHIYDFFSCIHSIGNFIPCPIGCNQPRGYNNHKIEDYWDLTLYLIYQWYHDKDDEHLEVIVKDKFERFKEWLETFKDESNHPSWDIFVESNFLQDYTEWDTKPYGRPKEYWDGHFSGPVLPTTIEQIEAFFSHAAECIRARGVRMVAAL